MGSTAGSCKFHEMNNIRERLQTPSAERAGSVLDNDGFRATARDGAYNLGSSAISAFRKESSISTPRMQNLNN